MPAQQLGGLRHVLGAVVRPGAAPAVWVLAAGAQPRRALQPEIGWHRVEVTPEGARDPLIGPLATGFEVFLWHSYEAPPPPGA